ETFLGMQFTSETSKFFISMENYIFKYAKQQGYDSDNHIRRWNTPGQKHPGAPRTAKKDDPQVHFSTLMKLSPSDQKTFQSYVGAFQWISNCGRPDITYATQVLASRTHEPLERDLIAAKRLLGYLIRTASSKMVLSSEALKVPSTASEPSERLLQKTLTKKSRDEHQSSRSIQISEVDNFDPLCIEDPYGVAVRLYNVLRPKNNFVRLTTYTDADFAGDLEERRSTIGYIVFLNSIPISWCSQRIKCTTTSTFESECMAISEACKEISYLIGLVKSLGIEVEMPTTVYNDNISAAYTASGESSMPKARHSQIRFCHIRGFIRAGIIRILHTRTEEMVADIFTKYLPRQLHYNLSSHFMDHATVANHTE
ncbi:MAG: Ty1/Copia family ribonuclease HI, partial [Bacteroidota bacterium]